MIETIIENLEIKNVVILDSDKAGDLYMEKLFPYWVDVTVITLEGKYPLNLTLRNKVLKDLENNENLICFCFGSNADRYPLKTKKKLRLASFLYKDLTFNKWSQSIFDFNEERIVGLMMGFSGDTMSRLKIERIDKYNSLLKIAQPDSVKWYHHLIES
jgi:hypothetical protein